MDSISSFNSERRLNESVGNISTISFMKDYKDNPEIETKVKWEKLRWTDKVRLFNYWSPVVIVTNLLQIFGSSIYALRIDANAEVVEILIGFSMIHRPPSNLCSYL